MKVKLPDRIRLLLVGAGNNIKYAMQQAGNYFDDVYLITNSKWDSSWTFGANELPIIDLAKKLSIPFTDTSEYSEVIESLKKYNPNTCFVNGAMWIFKYDFLNYFNGAVFNCHPAALPEHRGGGVFSWHIMNNNNVLCITVHQMLRGIDTGAVIIQEKTFINSAPKVLDFYHEYYRLSPIVVDKFLKILQENQGKTIEYAEQNHWKSTYYPLLETNINGAINFDWHIGDIERFIRAFSYPYNGAFTMLNVKKYNNQPIHIMDAEIDSLDNFHPFFYGLVTRHYDDIAGVICNGGILRIKKISIDKKDYLPRKILRIGSRLYTPSALLERGLSYRRNNIETNKLLTRGVR
jgi:methionyl-tRNA formyltransferase